MLTEHGCKFFRNVLRIFRSDLEAHDSSDVTEHRIAHLRARLTVVLGFTDELTDVLVRHDEPELVLTGLAEDRREGIRDEILELVDVEVEPLAVTLRNICSRERGHIHFVDENQTKQLRVHVADLSLREIHEQHFAGVHNLANIERGLRLSDDIAHRRIRDEGTELRGEVWDHFFLFSGACLRDFVFPETADHCVLALANFVSLELVVHEQSRNIDERRTLFLVIHQR